MIIRKPNISAIMRVLEIDSGSSVARFLQSPIPSGLDQFKKDVKSLKRKLSLKYHPDINPDGEERMKEILDCCEFLNRMRVVKAPIAQVIKPSGMEINIRFSYGSTATSTAGTYYYRGGY